ncbi:trypsin-like peptidase domain-containing protein [Dactylosporangium darangshiense]|uniref:trypsin-like peptidase domain-containing protein n=1 Tax=Dactylosporangium darangshiense TaxID=579108 RepID=UPI0036451C1C
MVPRHGGMSTLLDDTELRRLVVQVRAGSSTGSGFFVAPGLVLTCAHIVRNAFEAGEVPSITWQGVTVTGTYTDVVPTGEYPDTALIAVSFRDHSIAVFDEQVAPHDRLYAFGHTDEVPAGDSIAGRMEGPAGGPEPLLRFAETQVRPGASGAPLLNLRTGAICGMVKSSRGRSAPVGGRAVPVDALVARYPVLRERLRLHLELAIYLRAVAELVNRRAAVYFRDRTARDHYLAPTVRRLQHQQNALTHVQQMGSFFREPSADTAASADKASEVVSWLDTEAPPHTVILGGPGGGKTVLLQLTAAELARRALGRMSSGAVDELAPPVLLPVGRVAELGVGPAVEEAVLALVDPLGGGKVGRSIARHLVDSLGHGDVTLLLDSLDEAADPDAVAVALRAASERTRVVLVSRPYMFVPGVLPFADVVYFDLVGFDDGDRRRFVRTWFSDRPGEADAVMQWLSADTSLAPVTSSPLVTGLACVACEAGSIPAGAGRVELYRAVLRAIAGRGLTGADPQVTGVLRMTRRLAWLLFRDDPARATFDEEECHEAARAAIAHHGELVAEPPARVPAAQGSVRPATARAVLVRAPDLPGVPRRRGTRGGGQPRRRPDRGRPLPLAQGGGRRMALDTGRRRDALPARGLPAGARAAAARAAAVRAADQPHLSLPGPARLQDAQGNHRRLRRAAPADH